MHFENFTDPFQDPHSVPEVYRGQFSSIANDPLYARAGIPEVWLVALLGEEVEIYSRPVDGVFQQIEIVKPGQSFESQALDGASIAVERIFG